jgi:hypothetical protein
MFYNENCFENLSYMGGYNGGTTDIGMGNNLMNPVGIVATCNPTGQ